MFIVPKMCPTGRKHRAQPNVLGITGQVDAWCTPAGVGV
jgi:hypothetical protein